MSNSLRKILACGAALCLTLATGACSKSDEKSAENGAEKSDAASTSLSVYATTGYLADAVKNIDPDAEITTMVGPGGDPHTYQPSTQDIEKMKAADVVLWNGLHLEAQMIDQLESFGDKQLAVGDQIDESLLLPWPETDHEGNPLHDPHIWNSPEIWSQVVDMVAKKLGEANPDKADEYKANAEKYIGQIKEADAKAKEDMSTIPDAPRILITGHDAFNYFGKTYNLEVHATDFVSTEAKLSPKELSELADLIAENKVPVIFQDNQANPQAITSLKEAVQSRGWDVKVSDAELYADSLGAEENVDTYLEVFAHNAAEVGKALGE